jgi:4-oxalomesaconate hydratase
MARKRPRKRLNFRIRVIVKEPHTRNQLMSDKKTAMVVSAHSADFVWRAGGAIALYAERGWRMVVVCLSLGERGESAKLWRLPGMTLEKVEADRKNEALRAAEVLGAEVIFFDLGDYPSMVSFWSSTRLLDYVESFERA